MLFIGIIIGIIAIFVMQSKQKSQGDFMTMDKKIVVFLIGIMILGAIGGSAFAVFSLIGKLAFILLIVFLGYLLFKKLFMK